MKKSLLEQLYSAREHSRAIAHFNVSTIDMLYACVEALEEVQKETGEKVPLVIGLAEKERDWMGGKQMVEMVRSIADERALELYIDADHTYSVERACRAIDAGYDMVIIDYAEKSYHDNLAATQAVVDYRNQKKSHALIESELGFIGSGSQIRDSIPEGVSIATMTKADDAFAFVQATGIDCLAPSVGNVHGMVRGGEPRLHAERVAELSKAIPTTPMVLHGGSGSTDEDFLAVIASGISMIHISTELRRAYKLALQTSVNASEEMAPYKYLMDAKNSVKAVAKNRIKLFWGIA